MSTLQIFIFGAVEGITEFLPVSSTGHLILTARLLEFQQTEFMKSFEIAIQLGAILAVAVLYYKTLLKGFLIWKRLVVAFLPTALLGLTFYRLIKRFLLGSETVVLWSLLLGGVFLIAFELFYKEKEGASDSVEGVSYKQSFLIGLFQSIAMVPGVSRSAATIVGGLSLGLKRKTIVEFSFLLAIPTMLAATALDLGRNIRSFTTDQLFTLGMGFIVSLIVAVVAIRFLLFFIRKHNFIIFGIYRIAAALFFWYILS